MSVEARELTVPASLLAELINAGMSAPDDPEPHGPGTPYLGPSPVPWRWVLDFPGLGRPATRPSPDPWRGVFGPFPQPWRVAIATRLLIARTMDLHEAAEAIAGGGELAIEAVRGKVGQFIDDFCGTPSRPPRPPRPCPYPWGPILIGDEEVTPAALILAGAELQRAAEVLDDHPLGAIYGHAAGRFIEAGVEQFNGGA